MQSSIVALTAAHRPVCGPVTHARRPQHVQKMVSSVLMRSSKQYGRLVQAHSQLLRVRGRKDVRVYGLFGLGLPELAVIAGVAALIWGPSKLPEIGKSLGKAAKGLQDGVKEFNEELKKATTEEEEKGKLPGTSSTSNAQPSEAPKKE